MTVSGHLEIYADLLKKQKVILRHWRGRRAVIGGMLNVQAQNFWRIIAAISSLNKVYAVQYTMQLVQFDNSNELQMEEC